MELSFDEVRHCRQDLSYFAEKCFGFSNTWFHVIWYNTIQLLSILKGIIIAPRGSAKSTCWAKVAPLWLLGNNPNLRIVILSRTSSLAQRNLAFIRQSIESNDEVKQVFEYSDAVGRSYGLKQSSPWGVEQITVENDRRDGDCSIYAVGLGGTITGIRADVIIVDDLIDINNVMTDGQREKVIEYWRNVVIPTLNPTGRIFCVGTRWHNKDFYSMLLDDEDFKEQSFSFTAIQKNEEDEEISYWPERFPLKKLYKMRDDMGSLAFNTQMMCDPSGYEGNTFKPEDIGFYDVNRDLLPIWGDLEFIMAVDPNITENPDSDNTAIVTAAVDRRRNTVYVLDIFAKPLEFVGQVKLIKMYGGRHQVSVGKTVMEPEIKISKIGVDATAYQRSLQKTGYLMGLPVIEIKTGNQQKLVRLVGLQPHFENGRLRFPDPDKNELSWYDAFYEEYVSFPKGRRDDILDALEMLVSMVSESFGTSGIPWGPSGDGLQVRRGGRFMDEVLGRMIR